MKNQALNRISQNLKQNTHGLKLNKNLHTIMHKSIDWVLWNRNKLLSQDEYSLGNSFYWGILFINPSFIDNKEEYLTLRKSGLIELLKNDKVVRGLQSKYMFHSIFKDMDDEF